MKLDINYEPVLHHEDVLQLYVSVQHVLIVQVFES